jgi:hypothetical protein
MSTSSTQLKVDLFVAGGTPLDTQQLARRRSVDVGGGRILPVHPPEDVLLQKLRWYLREYAPAFGIEALLTDALSEGD